MLIDYKNIEPIMYRQMKNSLNNLSHAYLFNLNGNVYANDMIKMFIKAIICGEHKTREEYRNCTLCKRIDDNNFLELIKIYPDGVNIKKESLDQLQKKFSNKSIEFDKQVYIIYESDKLNKSAANSLLKFLEEPKDNIIAILVTNNMNQMIDTIVSRCQVLTFRKNKTEDYIRHNNISNNLTLNKLSFFVWKINDVNEDLSNQKNFIENVIRFIKKYENCHLKTIVYTKEYFCNCFIEKADIFKFYECMILFYSDVINYIIMGQVAFYDDYIEFIDEVSKKNSKNSLINKLDVIINCEKLINTNANVNLLIDRMIIDMEDGV